jgi:hypothetical protein
MYATSAPPLEKVAVLCYNLAALGAAGALEIGAPNRERSGPLPRGRMISRTRGSEEVAVGGRG